MVYGYEQTFAPVLVQMIVRPRPHLGISTSRRLGSYASGSVIHNTPVHIYIDHYYNYSTV